MPEHTVKAFSEELDSLGQKIAAMGGLAERQLADAVASIEHVDLVLADRTAEADVEIDALEHEIEAQAILMIARRQPMPVRRSSRWSIMSRRELNQMACVTF